MLRFRCLEKGDSGSILYEQRSDKVDKEVVHCRPLGMFIGRPGDAYLYDDVNVYQAIILKQALQDIESAYEGEITDLQPFIPASNP